jgi:hypothetical protein
MAIAMSAARLLRRFFELSLLAAIEIHPSALVFGRTNQHALLSCAASMW